MADNNEPRKPYIPPNPGDLYRRYDCPECGRHRVDLDGVCEKCLWDSDNGNWAAITRPNEYTSTGRKHHQDDD